MIRGSEKVIGKCGMTKRARKALGLRQVADIGLWAVDNGHKSCKWRTKACKDCYNVFLAHAHPVFANVWYGDKDELAWENTTSEAFKGLNRVRLCTRGDPFPTLKDVDRVGEWIRDNPTTLFWIPTRAWQMGLAGKYALNMPMIKAIEKNVMCYPNARVQASIDDWTKQHWQWLAKRRWSTMYFSKDDNTDPAAFYENGNVVKCRKTWDIVTNDRGRKVHRKGVCRTCRKGCFSEDRVDIWLKYH